MKPDGARGVSPLVRTTVFVGVAIAAVLIWYLRRGDDPAPAHAAPVATGGAAAGSPAKRRPTDKVKQVTPEERKQVAQQIRDARAGRAATSAPAGPSLPAPPPSLPPDKPTLDTGDVSSFKTTMRAAMKEVIPYIASCYDKFAYQMPEHLEVHAKLDLTGDPDVGTLIDTEGLADEKDAPLHAGFDLCMRDALAGLELPPLAEGEQVKVTYPFVFTR
jgi:uncharacterized membrane protein